MDGYIRLYRKILDNPVFQNERLLKVFIWCLLKATYKERDILVGLQCVKLQPGQFVYGRLKAAQELKIKPSTLNDHMHTLNRLQIINIKSNNKFSVITVENWALYQLDMEETDNKSNNKATAKQQQADTNKKDKKDKKEKKNIYTAEFEAFYSIYPNAFNKPQSYRNWCALLKKGVLAEDIMKATNNYIQYLKENKVDSKFYVRSTNFMGQKQEYAGYLDYTGNIGKPDKLSPISKFDKFINGGESR